MLEAAPEYALEEGELGLGDCGKIRLAADRRLRCRLTLGAGEIVYNPNGLGLPTWERATA